jgi:hypothetical protein
MIAALEALAALLARDPLTVDDVIAHLGPARHDYGANVVLAPRDPSFTEANVMRDLDSAARKHTATPALVTLTPAEPPAVKTLAEHFGPYHTIPAEDKGIPPQVIFYLDQPGQPRAVALIAEVRDGRAARITLRRDQRL